MENTLADRLRSLMKQQRYNQTKLAKKVGCSQPTISRILNGEDPGNLMIKRLSEVLGVSEQWLRFGDETNVKRVPGTSTTWDSNTVVPPGMVKVPFFKNMSLSAGSGALNSDCPHDGAVLWFSKDFLKRKGACPECVFCVLVVGDSMSPRYDEGGIVVIDATGALSPGCFQDLSVEERRQETMSRIADGKVYAINHKGQDYIKRLRRLSSDTVLITSENKVYPPVEANASDLHIIGKVIAYQREE